MTENVKLPAVLDGLLQVTCYAGSLREGERSRRRVQITTHRGKIDLSAEQCRALAAVLVRAAARR